MPEIASAVGVSTRTFNNYFSSKEAAIVWPATRRAAQLASNLIDRPGDEPLGAALVSALVDLYTAPQEDGLPHEWLRNFRALVATEPSLRGEYLKVSDATEATLAHAIARRNELGDNELRPRVLAAIVVGAERAAVVHWMQSAQRRGALRDTVRVAVEEAVSGIGEPR